MVLDPPASPAVGPFVYVFENAELHTGPRELRVAGRVVPIEPRVYDLLLALIERRDRVVGRGELFERLWPSVRSTTACSGA